MLPFLGLLSLSPFDLVQLDPWRLLDVCNRGLLLLLLCADVSKRDIGATGWFQLNWLLESRSLSIHVLQPLELLESSWPHRSGPEQVPHLSLQSIFFLQRKE